MRSLSHAFESRAYRLYKRATASTSTCCFLLCSLPVFLHSSVQTSPDLARSLQVPTPTLSFLQSHSCSRLSRPSVTDTTFGDEAPELHQRASTTTTTTATITTATTTTFASSWATANQLRAPLLQAGVH